MRKRLEYVDDKSSKFWTVLVERQTVNITYGKIGTEGRESIKEFDNLEDAEEFAKKKLNEKLKKGYIEVQIEIKTDSSDEVVLNTPLLLEVISSVNSADWEKAEEKLEEVSDDWQALIKSDQKQFLNFMEQLVLLWPKIKEADFENRAAWLMLYLTKRFRDEIGSTPDFISEDIAFELGETMYHHADDADQFTQGYAYTLYLFPESNKTLEAILDHGADSGYLCEGAIEDAVKTANNPVTKLFLKSLDILATFHQTVSYDTDKKAMEFVLRDIEWAHKEFPEFSYNELVKAKDYIKTKEFSKYWDLPKENHFEEIQTLFTLLG
ncbi:MAG: WGR domain-containing protein [Flavobacteriales bacterium]|nr:WGR domain-containing protein [Flavobacteriales bacterium]